jgi:hypothetical protein
MDFQWTFEILDYKASEFPLITIRASSQRKAYSKIKKMKLHELQGDDIRTQLRLREVLEMSDLDIDWDWTEETIKE